MNNSWTLIPMWAAAGAVALAHDPSILGNTISYSAWIANTIIEKTSNGVDSIMNLGNWATSAILTPLAALYWWVKWAEFIDDKLLKLENKYGKFLWKTLWGLFWVANTPTAAVLWTWIATYKWIKWAWGWIIDWTKSLWNKWYSKPTTK